MWRMPLYEGYGAKMKDDMADLKNISGEAWGGACTAAGFLEVRPFFSIFVDCVGQHICSCAKS